MGVYRSNDVKRWHQVYALINANSHPPPPGRGQGLATEGVQKKYPFANLFFKTQSNITNHLYPQGGAIFRVKKVEKTITR